MSRTIREIYNEAVEERKKRMELDEFQSDSKMSVMNGLLWVAAAIIHSFEVLLDAFAIDISNAVNERVNGTPLFYANALLQYQKGDELSIREDGLAFGYADTDESKRVITQVSYTESTDDLNLDSKLILKIATGEKGRLEPLPPEELIPVTSYINKVKFAGTRIEVVSRQGDVLVPRITVYHDGALPESEVYAGIEEKLYGYIMQSPFDSTLYTSALMEAVRSAGHVRDVYIDEDATPEQGFFLASYNGDGHIGTLQKIRRTIKTSSGFVKESSGKGEEKDLPAFRAAIRLVIDG